ncbi:hypothetical protein [Leptolyngbya sp. GB1-A1]
MTGYEIVLAKEGMTAQNAYPPGLTCLRTNSGDRTTQGFLV